MVRSNTKSPTLNWRWTNLPPSPSYYIILHRGGTKLELLPVQETRDLLILELHYTHPPELAAASKRTAVAFNQCYLLADSLAYFTFAAVKTARRMLLIILYQMGMCGCMACCGDGPADVRTARQTAIRLYGVHETMGMFGGFRL